MHLSIANLKKEIPDTKYLINIFNQFINVTVNISGDHIIFNDLDIENYINNLCLYEISRKFSIKSDYDNFCKEYDSYISLLDKDFFLSPSRPVRIPGQFDLLSDYKLVNYRNFFLDKKYTNDYLKNDLKDFIDKFGNEIKYIRYLKTDPKSYQRFISLIKCFFYFSKFGIKESKRLISDRDALMGLIPNGFELSSYFNSLMCFSPHMVAIPITRMESTIFLFSKNNFNFFELENLSTFQTGFLDYSVLEKNADLSNKLTNEMTGYAHRQYMEFICYGLNNFFKTVLDFRNYTDKSGEIDALEIIKILSAIKLIFVDLSEINKTLNVYTKQRFAFHFIDKLSNLRCRKTSKKEDEDAKYLTSIDIKNELISILKAAIKTNKEFGNILPVLMKFTNYIFSQMQKEINDDISGSGNDYCSYLRVVRNTAHGPYLLSNKYENNFLKSTATIPVDFHFLPIILTWAMLLNPKKILCL